MKGEVPMNQNYYGRANTGNRFIGGGFFGPFILGGITGGLLAPAFYNNNRPCCGPYPMPYYPYGPYYYR